MAKLPPRRVADVRAIPGFPYVSDEYAMAIGYVAVFWSLAEEFFGPPVEDIIGYSVPAAQGCVVCSHNGSGPAHPLPDPLCPACSAYATEMGRSSWPHRKGPHP